jgi:uncharacterized RDD family membrane protein YckC
VHSIDQLRIDTPEQIALELPLAGIGSRFLALAIDTLLQSALYFFGFLAVMFMAPVLGSGWLAWIPPSWGPALILVFLFCVYWGYFASFEILWQGQTPGKRLAGIRVIKDSGRPINTYEAIGRNLMRAIDSLPTLYGVGIVCMMLSSQNRRLGDYVAGTVVVHDKKTDEVRPDWNLAAAQNPGTPDVAQVSADELVLIETYLHRRWNLDPAVRVSTALQIAAHIKAKTGLSEEPGQSVDDFLESAARMIRDGARFR